MKKADSQRVHSKTRSETSRKPLFFLGKPLHVHLHQGGNRSETTIFYNEKRGFPVWGIYYSFKPGRETSGLLRQRRPVGDHHWPHYSFKQGRGNPWAPRLSPSCGSPLVERQPTQARSIINRLALNREHEFCVGWMADWLAG